MIRKENIALAESIAVALHPDAEVKPSDMLLGLIDQSYGALPYTDQWRAEVAEVTGEITSHTPILEVSTTRMAEIIRGAFEMVKTYGVPLAGAIADSVAVLYTPNQLHNMSTNELTMNFANIDHPFFNSSIYPTEVRNKSLSFSGVGLDVLKRLEFGYASEDEVKKYLKTDHPDINEIVNSKEYDLSSTLWAMTYPDQLGHLFHKNGEGFDFTRIRSIDIDQLLKMYVLASKMFSNSEPAPFLVKGSLADYREFVELIWNGLTAYLITLKKSMELYRGRKLVIVDNEPVSMVDYMPNEALDAKLKVVGGNVTIYFTNEVIKEAEANGVAMADVVMTALYARANGRNVGLLDLVHDKNAVQALLTEYHGGLHATLEKKSYDYFQSSSLRAIAKFIVEHPAAQEALTRTVGDTDSSVLSIVRQKLADDIDKLYYLFSSEMKNDNSYGEVAVSESGESPYRIKCIDIVLKTTLVPVFLRLLGCDLAAEIVELTFVKVEVEDNLHGKRERLHGALIELLASKLLA